METKAMQTVLRAVMGCGGLPAWVLGRSCLRWMSHWHLSETLPVICDGDSIILSSRASKSNFCDWQTLCRAKEQLWPVPTDPTDSKGTSAAPWYPGIL